MDPDIVDRIGREPHGSSDDPDLLDFSANANPEVPEGAREAYKEAFERARTYPEEPPADFRAAAADYVDCEPGSVVPAPGGLAAIRLAVATTVTPGDTVLIPAPSFGEYEREVRLQGGEAVVRDHDRIAETDPAAHAMAVVCNPNNPTGDAYDADSLRSFAARCRDAGTLLLVDEAFLGFTDRPSLAGEPGVVVARALTKLFGLPGLRAGFAVATGNVRERLLAARRTWNLGRPALDVGAYCMRQSGFVADTCERVREERARMRAALSGRYEVAPSEAPFLLLEVDDVGEVIGTARASGVEIRDARTFRGLESHVRVAVRLPEENDRLLDALGVGP